MPRHAKGPRLYLRSGDKNRAAFWIIRDGSSQFGTGLGTSASEEEKEAALAAYLTRKRGQDVSTGKRDPSQIPVMDVIAKYVRDKHIPYETELRIAHLRAYWGHKRLSDVTGDNCREYAARRRQELIDKRTAAAKAKYERDRARYEAASKDEKKKLKKPDRPKIEPSDGAARRELEDLRAAINWHRQEGLHEKIVSVILPARAGRRERWLTRSEAAHLILTTWRYREPSNFRGGDRHTRRHVARFMMVARYMGSRASVICEASIEKRRPKDRAWIDLNHGMFYGRPERRAETKKRRQEVPIPPRLLTHLRRWQRAGQRYVVEWHGEPVKRISKAHAAAVTEAGFDSDVTPHTWRHSVATWLMQRGADVGEAAQHLAMTEETLLRVYKHHRPGYLASVHGAI